MSRAARPYISLGALTGVAPAAATAHTSHTVLFTGVAATAATAAGATTRLTRTLASPGLEPDHHRVTPDLDQGPGLPQPRLRLLVALATATLLGEGTAADWAAVHLHDLVAVFASSLASPVPLARTVWNIPADTRLHLTLPAALTDTAAHQDIPESESLHPSRTMCCGSPAPHSDAPNPEGP
ncbi:hypothetical protein E0500_038400 [Streptomyces sp. KM273126]|uniref:hypothetical protein n=1 Tax=Streptomyces sp. KM273126 TaxID=2545247 RepID=UPI00103A4C71|nr:hypothetical protein [Streptomyces sp. KM273126]MBA2813033.1 hypothetical protein [Streptomyces sp. KM273126]